jgi:hypothetical protein
MGTDLFLRIGLDDPNHVDLAGEFFLNHHSGSPLAKAGIDVNAKGNAMKQSSWRLRHYGLLCAEPSPGAHRATQTCTGPKFWIYFWI